MGKSPGHLKWPEHRVSEQAVKQRMLVKVGNEVVADSKDVIRVEEDGSPTRFYFPRSDVGTGKLQPSDLTTECPFKGTARYFNLHVGSRELANAVWSYEDPYEEHSQLASRVAFYDDKMPEIEVKPA